MAEETQPESTAPEPAQNDSMKSTLHPGSKDMPRWNVGELVEPPEFNFKFGNWRNWYSLLGPGLLMGGAAIGGGEWLVGPIVTAKYGGALMWVATLSILAQVLYNIEISRYTLYTGEPIFTGKFRIHPGPIFWLCAYLVLDFGAVFPYLAANAATPLATILKSGVIPQPEENPADWWLMKGLAYAIFLTALIPLIIGGKIYNAIKGIMTFKVVVVLGFLMFLALFYSNMSTWVDIGTGFFKIGNVPVRRGEDLNGNNKLDPGEDWDNDGNLDVVEVDLDKTIDKDNDGEPDAWADINGDGKPDKFDDVDGDGVQDGDNVDNYLLALLGGRELNGTLDFTLIGFIAALAAIAGSGGLSNTPVSNYTRDQGWGMGHHVGAIPSLIGGHNLQLSHVGTVFEVTNEVLPRWKRWYRHVARDQLVVWMPACFIGLALPSMLSIQYLQRGYEPPDNWTAAAMTAEGVQQAVTNPEPGTLISNVISGDTWGNLFWFMTLFCGFLVLAPSMASSADGVIRRWVDVFWTGSEALRRKEPAYIRKVYFYVLVGYAILGCIMLGINKPVLLMQYATVIFNYALGISCWHALVVNCVLLPAPIRPGWLIRISMLFAGLYFTLLAIAATLKLWGYFG